MQVFRSLSEIDPFGPRSVVTVGNFDGVHRGHQAVLAQVRRRARELNARSVAITFDPHPAAIIRPSVRVPQLTTLAQKLRLLESSGIDCVLVLPFTEEMRQWSARTFAELVLRDTLNAIEVHEGETFRFGVQAEAGIEGLILLGQQCNFAVREHRPMPLRGEPASSSRVRAAIAAGRMHEVRALLGRPYTMHSTPARGRGYGTKYAVPTINLAPTDAAIPAHGVYITELAIGDEPQRVVFRGVTNVGNRPTFGEDSFAIESYLFDFKPLALDETTPLELTFLSRLRDERRFASPNELKAQILKDVARAERFFHLCDVLQHAH